MDLNDFSAFGGEGIFGGLASGALIRIAHRWIVWSLLTLTLYHLSIAKFPSGKWVISLVIFLAEMPLLMREAIMWQYADAITM